MRVELLVKRLVLFVLVGLVATVAWFVLGSFIRLWWPPKIPAALAFEHELASRLKLREVAEALAKRFIGRDDVVCLGVVRGNAARVLFHAGPENKGRNVNIHRLDYVLQVERVNAKRVRLRLMLNRPYSYFRIRESEMGPLVAALRASYGDIEEL